VNSTKGKKSGYYIADRRLRCFPDQLGGTLSEKTADVTGSASTNSQKTWGILLRGRALPATTWLQDPHKIGGDYANGGPISCGRSKKRRLPEKDGVETECGIAPRGKKERPPLFTTKKNQPNPHTKTKKKNNTKHQKNKKPTKPNNLEIGEKV